MVAALWAWLFAREFGPKEPGGSVYTAISRKDGRWVIRKVRKP